MKWAVLVSGSGTILESMLSEGLEPGLVLADRPGIRAIDVVAKNFDVPAIVIDRRLYGYRGGASEWMREDFTAAVSRQLLDHDIELVAMAGFDTVLSVGIFDKFTGKILNTHPALLPSFTGLYGRHVIQATLDARVNITGCTIHIATEIVDDASYIVAQKEVPVMPGDTVETLWERIKIQERKLYPQVVSEIIEGKRTLPQLNAIINQ